MPTQRILVVDDDHDVVRLMRGYLEQANYDVLVAYDGENALHLLRRERPDLVLLDWMLPDRAGDEIVRLVRGDSVLAQTPIIMLTARVADIDKIVGLELGADDYVTKPYNPREVLARVRARLRLQQETASSSKLIEVGGLQMDIDRHEARVDGARVGLTATEFELLGVLMKNADFVLTRDELMRQALGSDYEGVDRTLDSHIRNLRRKIERDPKNPQYLKTIYGVGYRLESGEAG